MLSGYNNLVITKLTPAQNELFTTLCELCDLSKKELFLSMVYERVKLFLKQRERESSCDFERLEELESMVDEVFLPVVKSGAYSAP